MSIMNDCVSMCSSIGATLDFLSNGWFCVVRGCSEVYYERLSELYADLLSGRLNEYLLSIC